MPVMVTESFIADFREGMSLTVFKERQNMIKAFTVEVSGYLLRIVPL